MSTQALERHYVYGIKTYVTWIFNTHLFVGANGHSLNRMEDTQSNKLFYEPFPNQLSMRKHSITRRKRAH